MIRDRVLVVAAHPDDCEFACGASVAKWTSQGAAVHVVVVTDGARGSHDTSIPDDVLTTERRGEQLRAAELLGIESVDFLDEPDGEVADCERLRHALVEAIRRVRPSLVLCHDPRAAYLGHPDHLAVGEAAWRAIYRAREPRFALDGARGAGAWAPQDVWLFETRRPDHTEEVSDEHLQAKIEALLCHRSQYETSMGFAEGDDAGRERFSERIRALARSAGEDSASGYGEAYARLPLV